jgi:hypothetical protein
MHGSPRPLSPTTANLFQLNPCQGQSQSYFTTGDLSPISTSWRQAPSDPRPEIFYNWTLAVTSSDEMFFFSEKPEPLLSLTTDGQSTSLSWNKAPIWGLRPDSYYSQIVAGLLMWGALSEERTGLSFTIAAAPRQRSHSRVRALWTCQITLRLAVYHQSALLGARPLETHD